MVMNEPSSVPLVAVQPLSTPPISVATMGTIPATPIASIINVWLLV